MRQARVTIGLSETPEGGDHVGAVRKIRKTTEALKATGRFCLNPLCLHVAGEAKCKLKCCKVARN